MLHITALLYLARPCALQLHANCQQMTAKHLEQRGLVHAEWFLLTGWS